MGKQGGSLQELYIPVHYLEAGIIITCVLALLSKGIIHLW